MQPFCKGRFRARLAETDEDLRAAQRLRYRAFRLGRGRGGDPDGLDAEPLDARCRHLLVETQAGLLAGTCRLLLLPDGGGLAQSYAGQFYDLSPLAGYGGKVLEIGRFCTAAGDPEVLRMAWAALTRIVDGESVGMMSGCSSFDGADPLRHGDALALLASRHLGPPHLRPRKGRAEAVAMRPEPHDGRAALAQMPPLLRTYLAMGGWVGDHAVIDRDLDTLHVFTAVEIAAIPPARARLLRADAA
ncbi:GNAT family N-acetyltransferase [Rhodobacteraceae bacterium HSP-20]|uniref:L-ornithine N(alpha)-acyltransferase n=1 Tax=Paragemmobacter amnigenus TaxID=2852097 RepID=A0ABS6J3J6_9RHOB|nr:GNAT family N-acetyltransferase [Rhodobacter amnigenus]MBV4389565.1 GNAT family N-acetyltransferase [Rhodobacter amnigenus]